MKSGWYSRKSQYWDRSSGRYELYTSWPESTSESYTLCPRWSRDCKGVQVFLINWTLSVLYHSSFLVHAVISAGDYTVNNTAAHSTNSWLINITWLTHPPFYSTTLTLQLCCFSLSVIQNYRKVLEVVTLQRSLLWFLSQKQRRIDLLLRVRFPCLLVCLFVFIRYIQMFLKWDAF